MSDEIKEILDYFKNYVNDKYETYTVVSRHAQNLKILLDYITNLQEENKRLKELCDKYEEEHSTTFEYWKRLIKEDYKSRCEKAISLLKEAGCYDEKTKTFCDDIWEELPELLNILTGGDKEWQ